MGDSGSSQIGSQSSRSPSKLILIGNVAARAVGGDGRGRPVGNGAARPWLAMCDATQTSRKAQTRRVDASSHRRGALTSQRGPCTSLIKLSKKTIAIVWKLAESLAPLAPRRGEHGQRGARRFISDDVAGMLDLLHRQRLRREQVRLVLTPHLS